MTHATRKKNLIVLVCGGRKFADRVKLDYTLDDIDADHGIREIIHGDAPGADRLAKSWAEARRKKIDPHPANWVKFGNKAGPIRNSDMLRKRPDIDLVVAFPMRESRGTWDMVRKARERGIEVMVIE